MVEGVDELAKEFRGTNICRRACYFTLLPDTKDIDIISEVNAEKYVILNNKTLAIKGDVKRSGGWYKTYPPGPKVQEPFNTLITPDLQAITVTSPAGQPSTILLSMNAHMITGKVYMMSFLLEKRKRVFIVDQIELPVTNGPGSFGLNLQPGVGEESGSLFAKFAWSSRTEADKTILSLARITADSGAKIQCEALAEKRQLDGNWSASGFVKAGFIWLLTEDDVCNRILKHSFDGSVSEELKIAPCNGEYPLGQNISDMAEYNGYAVTYFLEINGLKGSIWALDYHKMEWLNLRISFPGNAPQGINRFLIGPNGIAYLLGQASREDSEEVQILQFDIDKRLKYVIGLPKGSSAVLEKTAHEDSMTRL
uniref:Uncharacterized protein n=2 Tax=Plectus sambesii TaxID=2011161 RepID=A0A914XMC8_9BILA